MMNNIIHTDFSIEIVDGFLRYSLSVITDRALPDVRDGLKPVHRRIIYDMLNLLKLKYNKPYVKSAKIVGDVMGQLHPHGDTSIYDAACRLSLDFIMRYPLIDGHGNFGSIDGDSAAAQRYTEMRPKEILNLMNNGINENAVEMKPNFSEEILEPEVLPSLFPNLLVNGTTGIAVGMACSFLPHNLTEVCNALIAYIEKNGKITVEELNDYIKGPDFPMGGTIINKKDIMPAYRTGKTNVSLKVQGDYVVKEDKIIFKTIPYGITKDKIKEQVNKNIEDFENLFSNFEDNSDKNGISIEFTMLDKEQLDECLYTIFKKTSLQNSVSINNVCLVNGLPKQLGLYEIINEYVKFNNEVLININKNRKEKYLYKINILNGLLKALSSIDLVIELIRDSGNRKEAKEKLIHQLDLNEQQADAVLDMKLSKLTKLDEMDLKKELEENRNKLSESIKIIEEEAYRNSVLKNMIIDMRDRYGDERRTKIADIEVKKVVAKKENKDVIIAIDGINIKTVKTVNAKGRIYKTKSDSKIIAFCDDGMAYRCSAEEIKSTNTNIKNITKAKGNILAISVADNEDLVYHTTKNGMIKISKVSDFNSTRNGSVSAIKLSDDDKVVAIDVGNFISCYQETNNGVKGILDITDLKTQGKATKGVKGLKLKDDESIIKAYFSNEESDCKRNSRGQK